jgi:hypothetical protein
MARRVSSSPITSRDLQNRQEAIGDACELQFLAYGAPLWTRFLPTASQRQDASILLTFGGGDSQQRVGDSDAFQAKVGIGEGGLQWFSVGGEGTYECVRPWRSSRDSRFDLGHDVLTRR